MMLRMFSAFLKINHVRQRWEGKDRGATVWKEWMRYLCVVSPRLAPSFLTPSLTNIIHDLNITIAPMISTRERVSGPSHTLKHSHNCHSNHFLWHSDHYLREHLINAHLITEDAPSPEKLLLLSGTPCMSRGWVAATVSGHWVSWAERGTRRCGQWSSQLGHQHCVSINGEVMLYRWHWHTITVNSDRWAHLTWTGTSTHVCTYNSFYNELFYYMPQLPYWANKTAPNISVRWMRLLTELEFHS